MSLMVLSDEVIRTLLESLKREEAEAFAQSLKFALHEHSTGAQGVDASFLNQPERTSVYSDTTGATTLFMPSYSPIGHGVKVVTVSSPSVDSSFPSIRPTGSVTLYSPEGSPVGFLHAQTLTAFRTALASSCLLTKRARVQTITVFGSGLQAYWHVRLALMLRGNTIRAINIINRRFSDNAKGIMKRFYAVPQEQKQREGWEQAQFNVLTPGYGEYDRLQKEHVRAADVIYCCTPSTEDLFDGSILTSHEGRKKGRLIVAVGSYQPHMRELPKELLLQAVKHSGGHFHFHRHATEGGVIVVDSLDGCLKEAGEIIEAGLQPNQLVELGELAMIHRLARAEEEDAEGSSISESFSKLNMASSGSAMSTVFGSDTSSTKRSTSQSPTRTRRDSGNLGKEEKRKSGGGFHLPSLKHHQRTGSSSSARKEERDDHLARWLTSGNVIYKSVGFGLMDLVVGLEVVKLAKERGVGSHIENFSS
ncbi:UbiD family decarboxylase [Xylariaceae sp. FL1019]|nr:UbiD family decarboxylase [Xylariaceae sp. FL1019]